MMQVDGSQLVTQYRPPLIRLTLIGNPDVDDGAPSACYVDPQAISHVRRTASSYVKFETRNLPRNEMEFHEQVNCTEVNCCHYTLLVIETPAEVAMLRDRALGHEPPKPTAVPA